MLMLFVFGALGLRLRSVVKFGSHCTVALLLVLKPYDESSTQSSTMVHALRCQKLFEKEEGKY